MKTDRRSAGTNVDFRFGVLTAVYVAVIYWLSSQSGVASVKEQHPLLLIASNLAHVPVFAGLAFCVLKAISGPHGAERYAMAFGITTVLAMLDEWHQSFVPGRTASGGDLLADVVGAACLLLFFRARTLSLRSRCEAE